MNGVNTGQVHTRGTFLILSPALPPSRRGRGSNRGSSAWTRAMLRSV